MKIKVDLSSIRDTKWYEYLLRFILGGIATVATGLIAKKFGPITGGLFLAFPAIFFASATLIEKHEHNRKRRLGLEGSRRGLQAAGLDAFGSALGSYGLVVFAVLTFVGVLRFGVIALALPLLGWGAVCVVAWRFRRELRCKAGSA